SVCVCVCVCVCVQTSHLIACVLSEKVSMKLIQVTVASCAQTIAGFHFSALHLCSSHAHTYTHTRRVSVVSTTPLSLARTHTHTHTHTLTHTHTHTHTHTVSQLGDTKQTRLTAVSFYCTHNSQQHTRVIYMEATRTH